MTTAQIQRSKAIETYNRFKSRLSIDDMKRELEIVNGWIRKELKISKYLRHTDELTSWLNQRHYYKQLISMI